MNFVELISKLKELGCEYIIIPSDGMYANTRIYVFDPLAFKIKMNDLDSMDKILFVRNVKIWSTSDKREWLINIHDIPNARGQAIDFVNLDNLLAILNEKGFTKNGERP